MFVGTKSDTWLHLEVQGSERSTGILVDGKVFELLAEIYFLRDANGPRKFVVPYGALTLGAFAPPIVPSNQARLVTLVSKIYITAAYFAQFWNLFLKNT